MIDKFYSSGEAGDILGVDASTVLAWIHSGELVASNCSKDPNSQKPHWRIAAQELCRFMLARRHPKSDTANQPQRRRRKVLKKKPKQYV